jgi:hypothetical protein
MAPTFVGEPLMKPLDDKSLFSLISKADKNDFDRFNDAIGERISLARGKLMRAARKLARDLEGEDLVEIAIYRAVESLHDQFNGAPVKFKFDPALAPFDEYLVLHMGGKDGTRGVIGTLRQRRRRARTETIGEEEQLDHLAQIHKSQGTRRVAYGRSEPLPMPSTAADDFEAFVELETLSPRERFVLRMELLCETGPSIDLPALLRCCSFDADEQLAILGRTQAMKSGHSPQEGCAQLLGLKDARSVRYIKETAIKKLKARYTSSNVQSKVDAA